MSSDNDDLPTAVRSGTMDIAGMKVRVHVLDNGQRIIDAADAAKLLAWLNGERGGRDMTHTPLEQELLAVLEEALPLVIQAHRQAVAPFGVFTTRGRIDHYQRATDTIGEPPLVTRIRAALAKARGT